MMALLREHHGADPGVFGTGIGRLSPDSRHFETVRERMADSIFEPIFAGDSTYKYLLGGEWRESPRGELIEVMSPITGELLGSVQKMTSLEVDEACQRIAQPLQLFWTERLLRQAAMADVLQKFDRPKHRIEIPDPSNPN